jgi:hypothetical protein
MSSKNNTFFIYCTHWGLLKEMYNKAEAKKITLFYQQLNSCPQELEAFIEIWANGTHLHRDNFGNR